MRSTTAGCSVEHLKAGIELVLAERLKPDRPAVSLMASPPKRPRFGYQLPQRWRYEAEPIVAAAQGIANGISAECSRQPNHAAAASGFNFLSIVANSVSEQLPAERPFTPFTHVDLDPLLIKIGQCTGTGS